MKVAVITHLALFGAIFFIATDEMTAADLPNDQSANVLENASKVKTKKHCSFHPNNSVFISGQQSQIGDLDPRTPDNVRSKWFFFRADKGRPRLWPFESKTRARMFDSMYCQHLHNCLQGTMSERAVWCMSERSRNQWIVQKNQNKMIA